jgi:hypothetical protein
VAPGSSVGAHGGAVATIPASPWGTLFGWP